MTRIKYLLSLPPASHLTRQYLKDWGIEIANQPATITARVLPIPQVQYHQNSRFQGLLTPVHGVWNLVGQKVCAGAELGSWAVVCFAPHRSMPQPSIDAFVKEFCNSAVDSGVISPWFCFSCVHGRWLFAIVVLPSCTPIPVPLASSCVFAKPSRKLAMLRRLNLSSSSAFCQLLGYHFSPSSLTSRLPYTERSNVSPTPSLAFPLNATKCVSRLSI